MILNRIFTGVRFRLFVFLVLIATIWFWGAARYLVINSPARSELIVVLANDDNEVRFWKAFHLLQNGYGKRLVMDENIDIRIFGVTRG